MLTFEDCLQYCDVSQGEVDVVAKHEGLPEMVACELANYLKGSSEGRQTLLRFIQEDLQTAGSHQRGSRFDRLSVASPHSSNTQFTIVQRRRVERAPDSALTERQVQTRRRS